jgi:hypothetical protein
VLKRRLLTSEVQQNLVAADLACIVKQDFAVFILDQNLE